MPLEKKVILLKKLCINLFIISFIITTIIITTIVYIFFYDKTTLGHYELIGLSFGLLISIIITIIFYLHFKAYENLESEISNICSKCDSCTLNAFISILVCFTFKKKLCDLKENDICLKDNE